MKFENTSLNQNLGSTFSCNGTKEVSVFIYESQQEMIETLLGGYDISNIRNRRLPNGINSAIWVEQVERRDNAWRGMLPNDTLESAFLRKKWNQMTEFNDVYTNTIEPLLKEIFRNFLSEGKLDAPKFEYNDRELGNFSFDRASVELIPVFEYYDEKSETSVPQKNVEDRGEKSFDKTNGNEVFWIPKYEDKEKSKRACQLKREGKSITEIMGIEDLKPKKYASSVKKSFLYKIEKPKPKKAVRVVLDLSIPAFRTSEQAKWRGYGAVAIIKFLESIGYSTSLVGSFGVEYGRDTTYDYVHTIILKDFGQSLDTAELLYGTSDVSFIRCKMFFQFIYGVSVNNERIDSLGAVMDFNCVVFNTFRSFGARYDKLWQENISSFSNRDTGNFLYITFGQDVWTENAMVADLRRKITDVLNINNEAVQFAQANP
jgi:succinate dehydrogenase flavin-adding protein (antitoxin of CptAB toxin-antitoxin module)